MIPAVVAGCREPETWEEEASYYRFCKTDTRYAVIGIGASPGLQSASSAWVVVSLGLAHAQHSSTCLGLMLSASQQACKKVRSLQLHSSCIPFDCPHRHKNELGRAATRPGARSAAGLAGVTELVCKIKIFWSLGRSINGLKFQTSSKCWSTLSFVRLFLYLMNELEGIKKNYEECWLGLKLT